MDSPKNQSNPPILDEGKDTGPISAEVRRRMDLVSRVIPDVISIAPARQIDPEWCFRMVLKNGKRFLVWTNLAGLSGLGEGDGKRLFSDCGAARGLKHSNILTPLHITQAEDLAIVVTDDFSGQALFGLKKKRKMGYEAVKVIFNQVANTIEFAHKAGVLHRAICPANILVDSEGNVRIFGFGIANVFFNRWSETMGRQKRRIVDYVAPEIINTGMIETVPHCDGFSLGRVIYELLMGQMPKNSIMTLPSKVCKVPAFVDDALLNAMHGEPKMRPQTISEFKGRFNGLLIRESTLLGPLRLAEKRDHKDRFFDGFFSFINSGWFRLTMVLSLIGVLLIAALLYERYRLNSLPLVQVDDIMSVEELLKRWKLLSSEEIRRLHEKNAAHFEKIVEAAYHILVSREEFKEADQFLETMMGNSSRDFEARLKSFADNIDEYGEMMDLAKAARIKGDFLAEEAPLARALELFPDSETLRTFQANNPQRIAARLSKALEDIKVNNPGQSEWHYSLVIKESRVFLDLSAHAGLQDISPLRGQVIHELDLSRTGVKNLEDLIGMPVDELRIDQTNISDLSWVAGLPLRVLTFQDTQIKDISCLKAIPTLRCALGQVGKEMVRQIKPPLPDQQTWINENGAKFRIIPGTSAMLSEREYSAEPGGSPLTSISFKEAENLCSHMTVRARKENIIGTTHRYRLPTDGEWSLAAQLPESQFLTPRGRILQRVTGSDFFEHKKSLVVLEITAGGGDREKCHNGFWGLKNHIGEWVDHPRDEWDKTRLVRGIYAGTDLEKLRFRSHEKNDKTAEIIGFRLALEIDPTGETWDTLIAANPEKLAGLTLTSWKAPHLSAAASSSLIVKSLMTSASYRDAYISAPNRDRDPFVKHFYLRIDLPVNWVKARSIANQLGGRLAVATCAEHLAWLNERFVATNPLGTPVWMGASADPEQAEWIWTDGSQVPEVLAPKPTDTDKRRGALLLPGATGESEEDQADTLFATPAVERHSFLIEWDIAEKAVPLSVLERSGD